MVIALHALIHTELTVLHAVYAIRIYRDATVVVILLVVLAATQEQGTKELRLLLFCVLALTMPTTLDQAVHCVVTR